MPYSGQPKHVYEQYFIQHSDSKQMYQINKAFPPLKWTLSQQEYLNTALKINFYESYSKIDSLYCLGLPYVLF